MFKEAIIKEQRRNQRLIDLSTAPSEMEEIGNLAVERRGKGLYCYERRQKDGKKSKKRYLGKPESEAAQEHLGKRLKKEMILRLDHNQRVLQGLEKNYLDCRRSIVCWRRRRECRRKRCCSNNSMKK